VTQRSRHSTSRRFVYETLRRKVLTLELRPGEALSENELAAVLHVSRTPVRESLILLAEEGFVQVFPQVGSFVSRVDPASVADAQFLREAVELAALDDIPSRLDTDVVEELRDNLAQQQKKDIDVEEFFSLDEKYHLGLLRLSGHERAWSTVASAKGHLDRARRLGLEVSSPRVFAGQHGEILGAILEHDLTRARTLMRTHLRAVFADIEQIRARAPELFASNTEAPPIRRNVVVWE
jgi:DNA-binding GntR family transcriptional regulator